MNPSESMAIYINSMQLSLIMNRKYYNVNVLYVTEIFSPCIYEFHNEYFQFDIYSC